MAQPSRLIIVGYGIEPWPPHDEAIKNFVNEYARRLIDRDCRVLVVSRAPHIRFPLALTRSRGVTYLLLRTGRLGRRFHQALLILLSHLWSADWIHFVGRPSGYSPWLAVSRMTFLTIYDQGLATDARLAQQISPETVLIVESDWLRNLVRQFWQREAHVIYPGIDLSRFTQRSRCPISPPYRAIFASSPLRRHVGAAEDRYLESRGVPETIAISHLIGRQIDFETTLLWRKDPPRVLELIDHRRSVTVMQTYIHDMNEFLGEFDLCFALFRDAAHVKAVPQSVIECLAKGIPVVCRQGSALGNLLDRHGVSLNVAADAATEAACAIVELLRDQRRYHNMSAAAWHMAQRYFNIQSTVDQYTALYRSSGKMEINN
jgi:glycosyltransferase involved in cell wall biosynthesis